jgi:hypothetical protein
VPGIEAFALRLDTGGIHLFELEGDIRKGIAEYGIKDEILPSGGVLRIVHGPHVESAKLGPQSRDVMHALVDGNADGSGRVIDTMSGTSSRIASLIARYSSIR